MAESTHPAAPHHLPSFITAPGDSDWLMILSTLLLTGGVMAFGVLFFRLHTLPERIAHKSKKIQFELVAILGLIALFTHMHIFWIIGLILAVIDIPDFGSSLERIAVSAEKVADQRAGTEGPSAAAADDKLAPNGGAALVAAPAGVTRTSEAKPEIIPASPKEHSHA